MQFTATTTEYQSVKTRSRVEIPGPSRITDKCGPSQSTDGNVSSRSQPFAVELWYLHSEAGMQLNGLCARTQMLGGKPQWYHKCDAGPAFGTVDI
ncbi:hypothetical protein CapIbe_018454 [Capra ibex]